METYNILKHTFNDEGSLFAVVKADIFNQWIEFIDSFFAWDNFTDQLYKYLISHCSFMAHFNRTRFYEYYFRNNIQIHNFLKQFTTGISVETGDRKWVVQFAIDLNTAMIDYTVFRELEIQKYIDKQIDIPLKAKGWYNYHPEDNMRNNIDNKYSNFYTIQDKQTKPILVLHTYLFNNVRGSTYIGKRPDKVIIHLSYDQFVGITMGSENYRSRFHEWFYTVENIILPKGSIFIEVIK